ncbi:MAG: GatB/YqeY domain-containing protein [Brumimicrobium sp.]|nr:GatB/YqeY domain-containing protein [Brumimicrobium sp.]
MASLTDKINQEIKEAMLAKEKEKLTALRDIKAKILVEATAGHGEVDEAAENKIVARLYKQRMESYELYKQQGRDDLASTELFEAKIIEVFLPQMMSEDEIRVIVKKTISEVGASGPQDMGKVMGKITKELAGKADGKLISDIVKQELNK